LASTRSADDAILAASLAGRISGEGRDSDERSSARLFAENTLQIHRVRQHRALLLNEVVARTASRPNPQADLREGSDDANVDDPTKQLANLVVKIRRKNPRGTAASSGSFPKLRVVSV
jgi:hypothetical protein